MLTHSIPSMTYIQTNNHFTFCVVFRTINLMNSIIRSTKQISVYKICERKKKNVLEGFLDELYAFLVKWKEHFMLN